MQASFDLDGTLYDTQGPFVTVVNKNLQRMGYEPITLLQLRTAFQFEDWVKFYIDLGVSKEDAPELQDLFVKEWKTAEQPLLIPGAFETLQMVESIVGLPAMSFVTLAPQELVRQRFERDGLMRYFENTHIVSGKIEKLIQISQRTPNKPFYYFGDTVNDGQQCLAAYQQGASNLCFVALTHQYSITPSPDLKRFVKDNPHMSIELESLDKIEEILKEKI